MRKALFAVVVLAAGLLFMTGTARADAYLYVRDGIHLNARIGPGTRYRVHDVLAPGTRVEIVTRIGNWAHVRTPEGLMLWVYFTYLGTQPPHQILRPAPPIFLLPPPPRPRAAPPPPPPRWYTPRPRVQPHPRVQPQPRVNPVRPAKPKVQRPAKPKVQPKVPQRVKPKVQRPAKPKVQRPVKPKVQRPTKPKVTKPKVQRPMQPKRQPTQRQQQRHDPNELRRNTHNGR